MDGLLLIAILVDALLLVALLIVGFLLWKTLQRQRDSERALHQAETLRGQTSQQLSAVLKVSQKFVEAGNEEEIIDTILRMVMQTTGAMGASFVPFDERGKPTAAVRRGEFPFPVPDAYLEYLASTPVRQTCQQCTELEHHNHSCPLLKGPFTEAQGIYCYPLRYAGREQGILNVYIPHTGMLDDQNQVFLRSLADATALALEGERLRQRELAVLSQLRGARQKADLRATLQGMVENLRETLNAELTFVVLSDGFGNSHPELTTDFFERHAIRSGEFIPGDSSILAALATQVLDESKAVHGSQSRRRIPRLAAWVALPLLPPKNPPLGVLFAGAQNPDGFNNRQLILARSVADQMVLLVQSTSQLADLEYQTLMGERTRLAREIHDGLAQTLGFLKLQMAQMLGFHERGDHTRLGQALRTSYDALAAAYQDARQAIDGLRISPGGPDGYALENWLRQTVAETMVGGSQNPLTITIADLDVKTKLPPEVHAQLIRIVQEALSNIRKHARASQAWISCIETLQDLVLEVRDDGRGFSTDGIPDPSRYGLTGMRERAELLGADFQVISRPDEGTIVRVRLPLREFARMEES